MTSRSSLSNTVKQEERIVAQLTCQDLSLGYDGRVILQALNFEVNAGDYLCIVGENGAGKSTLMKTILGLQPPIKGKVLTGDGLKQTEIGYLPQQTIVQKDFPASVREIVLSGFQGKCGLRPYYNKQEKQMTLDAIKRLGLGDLSRRCYRELSGGQQQRVAVARALASKPKFVLADEPTANLDSKSTENLLDIMEKLNREENITFIFSTHDTRVVNKARRVITVEDGKVISDERK